jgi:hypothetical protein
MNKWYCLTIVWKTGELQTLWSIDWEMMRQLRTYYKGNEDIERCFLSRNGSPKSHLNEEPK